MKRLCPILVLLLFLSCSEGSNPISADNKSRVLIYSTFERSSSYSLEGWVTSKHVSDTGSMFSTDVPPGGNDWSVKLWGGYSGTEYLQATIPLSKPDSATLYILSFWAKGNGIAGVVLSSSQIIQPWAPQEFNEISWIQFTDTIVSAASDFDSLRVFLSRAVFDTTAVVQFDNVQVIEILP